MGIEPMVSALPMRCFTAKLRQPGPQRSAGRDRRSLQRRTIRFSERTYLLTAAPWRCCLVVARLADNADRSGSIAPGRATTIRSLAPSPSALTPAAATAVALDVPGHDETHDRTQRPTPPHGKAGQERQPEVDPAEPRGDVHRHRDDAQVTHPKNHGPDSAGTTRIGRAAHGRLISPTRTDLHPQRFPPNR